MTASQFIKAHGGEGILRPEDIPELRAATTAILELLSDGEWHTALEIKEATGGQFEATRRLRDLRPILKPLGYSIEKKRLDKRLFTYRLERNEPTQLDLF